MSLPQSSGLRLSILGGALVFIGALLLAVVPDVIAAIPMLIGGGAVGAGFIWTMYSFYTEDDSSETPGQPR